MFDSRDKSSFDSRQTASLVDTSVHIQSTVDKLTAAVTNIVLKERMLNTVNVHINNLDNLLSILNLLVIFVFFWLSKHCQSLVSNDIFWFKMACFGVSWYM